MRKLYFGICSCVLLVGGVAMADPYGTAGCGLGSQAFGDKKGMIQVVAATLNGTFGTQTFGISSGTSNCGETSPGTKAAQIFIEANREALAKDVSRGSGETIVNLSSIAGCPDPAAVGATLQKNFKSIFPAENVPNEFVVNSVLATLKAEKELACSHVG